MGIFEPLGAHAWSVRSYIRRSDTFFRIQQRPLKTIAKVVNDVFIPRGINVPALDMVKQWEYAPANGLKVGDHITGGDVFGVRWQCGPPPRSRV